MDRDDEILRALGRIEGELVEIRMLSQRVSTLEQWQFLAERRIGLPGCRLCVPSPGNLWEVKN